MTPGLQTRRLAFEVLFEVETRGAFADALLGRELAARATWPPSDRALATRLVYGVLAWQRALDWIADHWARPRSARLDPEVRVCLRLGLFQLFFSDRIPAFAAVDTAVELCKHRRPTAARLVNAVLRRATREGRPPWPEGSGPAEIGLRASHPDWMVERWLDMLGRAETERLLEADNGPSPLCLRAPRDPHARRAAEEAIAACGLEVRRGAYAPDAWIVEGGLPSGGIERLAPQGEASQLVVRLLEDHAGSRILDACAAPGGKATALAEAAGDGGMVIAIDLHRTGLARARELSARGRHRAPFLVQADARVPPFGRGRFDAALVDAPCSGVGTLRSHPEIRWRLRPGDLADLAARQRAILASVADLVRPGGVLVYATCSTFREENDEVVDAFLTSTGSAWRLVDPRPHLPAAARALADERALRTFPHRHGLDGFFAVRLERSSL